ncbi:MAG: hypothetical protein ACI9XJ_001017 [Marivirga sp.]
MGKMKAFFSRKIDQYRFLLKRYFHEIITSDKSDHMIALSYAIGTEIAILPTPGFSTAIGFGILAIFKSLNKFAVLLSMLVWNAITVLPVYWLSFQVGKQIEPLFPAFNSNYEWLNQAVLYMKQFGLGNLMVTFPISILSYFLVLTFLKFYRARKLQHNAHKLR